MLTLLGTVEKVRIQIPTLDQAKLMSAEELHGELQGTLIGTLVCHASAKILTIEAKRRMQAGIPVGGCLNFTGKGGYIDKYVKQEGQSLEAAQRASYRLLDGLGISEKFDSSKARAANKKKAEAKAKAIKDRKEKKEKDKARDAALEAKAKAAKSLKDKNYIQTLEAEVDKLKVELKQPNPSQAEASARPAPVKDVVGKKNPVNSAAARDANDLDAAVLLLRYLVFASTVKEEKAAQKAAVTFLKSKGAFTAPSAAQKPAAEVADAQAA